LVNRSVSNRKQEQMRAGNAAGESDDAEARPIIIVGPQDLSARIARTMGRDVVAFASLNELDAWRAGRDKRPDTVEADIRAALAEQGITLEELPPRLRCALEAIAQCPVVPGVSEVETAAVSRRSFYRAWTERMNTPPSAFLRRARALHAQRLLDEGVPPKMAALTAGFSSVDQMRRRIARRS
jgi:AraC-like DNA-binding protein